MANEQIPSPILRREQSDVQRVVWLDVLRVIATFGVILLHVGGTDFHLPVGEHNWYIAVVFDSLVRWSVPIFVMISGALFLKPEKNITIKTLLTKYVQRLLVVYLFWWLAYSCFDVAIASMSAKMLVFKEGFLKPHFHLWFLPMLMGVYLLIPVLRKVASDAMLLKYALTLWLVYLTISFLLVREVPQISHLFAMNCIVGYAGYFLLGFFLATTSLKKKQRQAICALGLTGALITVMGSIILSFHRGMDDEMFLSNISPQVVMMATALFVLVKDIAPKVEDHVKRVVNYVRKDLFGIYLVHGIWLFLLNRALFRNVTNHLVTLPLITLAIFVGSLYTTKLLRLLSGFKRFVE